MRITAGELDRRISFWRSERIDDGTAMVDGAPAEIGKRSAKKTDVSDGERVRAAEQGSDVTTRFLVRADSFTRTITAKDEIRYRDRTYEVTGVKDSPEREDGVEISTVSRTDTAA